ncbi:zinc finger BED domain-containing protein RICESLEEPER 2-like protein [Tanacetum coccineum]
MMKRVIAFEDFPVPNTGSALAKTLRNVFVNFNLENKIMSITLDNASNNTSAIGKLKLKYKPPMKDFVTHIQTKEFATFDVLGFLEGYVNMFLVLSRLAHGYISVQATSVASESAFSTSGRVLSIRRTRLTSASLEMCICLKDHLDARAGKNRQNPLLKPRGTLKRVLGCRGCKLLKSIPHPIEEIALDAASSEGYMSGPGSGGEEAEADYGYNVYHDDY